MHVDARIKPSTSELLPQACGRALSRPQRLARVSSWLQSRLRRLASLARLRSNVPVFAKRRSNLLLRMQATQNAAQQCASFARQICSA